MCCRSRPVSDRQSWLEQRHAAWQTPLPTLEALVHEVTGTAIAERERLIVGEANETYRIVTSDDRALVVKVSHAWERSFAAMHELSEALLSAGISVPRVLFAGRIDVGDRSVPAVVQTYIDGEPLSGAIKSHPEQAAEWTRQAGELLARIHQVPFDEPPLPDDLTPGQTTIRHALAKLPLVADALREHSLDPDRIGSVLEANERALDALPRCREHGDFSADHLIVADGRIIGVIDLDSADIGTPMTDIGWWDTYWDRDPHPTALLLEGYRRVHDLGDIEHTRSVFVLARSLEHLRYYFDVDNPSGARYILTLIEERLARLT